MSVLDPRTMSTSQLVNRFEQVCIGQEDALLDDALAKYRQLFDEMRVIVEELQSRSRDQRTALMPLYEHPNRQVRIKAAIHTLALAPEAARAVLEEIKAAQWYPQALDAGMMLRALDDGSYKPRIFYCLENFLRRLITAKLEDEHGEGWWDAAVPEAVRNNALASRRKEIASGVTPRSDLLIDYTNFGELNEIVQANWTNFGDVFQDQGALRGVLSRLNTLRNPIAHCKPLAEDEVVRLHLSLRDFFRQMGS